MIYWVLKFCRLISKSMYSKKVFLIVPLHSFTKIGSFRRLLSNCQKSGPFAMLLLTIVDVRGQ